MSSTRVAHGRVTFIDKDRTVSISQKLDEELEARGRGLLFPHIDYNLVHDALKKVAPELPKGLAVHALPILFPLTL